METKYKRIVLNLFLVVVICVLLLLFHAAFIAGPIRVKEHEDKLFVEAFATQNKLKDVEMLERFVLDEVYYIVKSGNQMYWFNKDFSEFGERNFAKLEKAFDKAFSLGFDEKDISYGVYDGDIVYALEKSIHYVYLDIDTLDIVFEFGGSTNVVE